MTIFGSCVLSILGRLNYESHNEDLSTVNSRNIYIYIYDDVEDIWHQKKGTK